MARVKSAGPPVDGRSTRWAQHRERRRAEFVDAAMRAVEQHGPDVLTEQIAAAAGVPRPKLYRYFDGKADLHRAVAERAVELFDAELEPLWHAGLPPVELVRGVVGRSLDWIGEHANLYRYLQRDVGSTGVYAKGRSALRSQVINVVTAYRDAIGAPAYRTDALAVGLVGLVEATVDQWLADPSGLSGDELTEELVRWIWAILSDLAQRHGVRIDPEQVVIAGSQ
ncbi:TetR/AcrR family transcriptional regulator [Saccharopolyspora erythraea]|uniref:TetR/AcrR family transcriptional regulator n=1 Tax=Saccharopolyspora erythraea TaxID=1836 RepID=UPI001BAD0F7D|nr:TetR/AcrR family transcriptional regulator [Saccharopolyspora erythraea]QUH06092.1 TetR/AcrR family transcriptional regulator [Saccharopolyspora erythraea]